MAYEHRLSLLSEKHTVTFGALFVGGHIPRGEIALRVFFTVVEYRTSLAVLHYDLRAAFGTRYAYISCLLL